jgi:DNA-directed RNA polymerase II subunit RPB1
MTTCPGHFGHITLAKPVFHVCFMAKIVKIMRCVCFYCSRHLIDPDDSKIRDIISKTGKSKRLDCIYDLTRKRKICPTNTEEPKQDNGGCGRYQPKLLKTGQVEITAELVKIHQKKRYC